MFIHNFIYSLKVLLKNKPLMFWSFAFPIVLGLLFNMAFKDIEKNEAFSPFNIAIISNDEFDNDPVYKEALSSMSEGDERIFEIDYVTDEEADSLLQDKKIVGYLKFHDGVSLVVNQNGINETILRFVVDEIENNKELISNLIQKRLTVSKDSNYEKVIDDVKNKVLNETIELNDRTQRNMSYTMIEYYTLIAMAALYGGTISMYITNKKLANMGSVGKRTSVASIKKSTLLSSSLLASYVIQIIELLLLFIFTIFVLHVDYGDYFGYVVLLALVGSLAGLSLGVLVATLINSNENTKIGILIAITMAGCFLSGMMGITMKYVIDTYVPIVNVLNPAALITDGFYVLYYYGVDHRLVFDICMLIILSIGMFIISIRGLRRKAYESI